jgi:hypothetical protein
LADGEVLKCFQPPFPPERAEWAHANYPTVPPEWVAGVVWRWKGPRLEYYAFRSSRDGKVPATDMVRGAIQVPLSAFEGPGLAWLDAKVTADVVFRDGTPPDKLATALGDALRRDFRIPVRLTYREEEREVIVARGTFPNLPVPGSRDKPILIYGKQPPGPGRNEGRTLQGPWSWFLDRLSLYTGTRVVSDNPAARQGMVYFRLPADLTRTCRHEGAAPFEVLAKVTEQTGLIFGTERRRVPVLVVEKVD